MKYNIFLLKKYVKEEKISKYIDKYVNVLDFFYVNLVVLSVTSGSITNVSFI